MNNLTNKETLATTANVEQTDINEIKLTHLNKDFVYELMSIPTVSNSEYRLVTFIILWARRNKIHYEFDDYGNVYLTKGQVSEGEYFPCVTAHLDTVQHKQKVYAQAGQELEVKTRIVKGKHEIYVDGMGIGGDDKAGVLIGLSMFSHVDKLKACFFLEEEVGCKGSTNLNKDWFKDVGYVIGYDSPDLNRAAWACSGTKLFDKHFFQTYIQDICKKHGLTDFRSEPFTDVKLIREKTEIICMNFGSGYYNCHTPSEYCVIEDMDQACRMGHDIITHLGNQRFELKHETLPNRWYGNQYTQTYDKDESFFDSLRPKTTYTAAANTTSTTSKTNKASQTTDENKISRETAEYIIDTYEKYIQLIQENVESICKENKIDPVIFKQVFSKDIKF